MKNTKAPVAHHFNGHQYCHRSWCWARDLDDLEQEVEDKIRHSQPKIKLSICSSSDDSTAGEIKYYTVDNYKDVINEKDDEESFNCEIESDIDSEHEYDEDDVPEFVARATYFQSSAPIFHGLSEAETELKMKQIDRHSAGHYQSMTEHEAYTTSS